MGIFQRGEVSLKKVPPCSPAPAPRVSHAGVRGDTGATCRVARRARSPGMLGHAGHPPPPPPPPLAPPRQSQPRCLRLRRTSAGLEPNALTSRRPLPEPVRFSGGSAREYEPPGPSLVILKTNHKIGGRETLLPGRLLQGVVPRRALDKHKNENKNALFFNNRYKHKSTPGPGVLVF